MARGDHSQRVRATSRDEVGDLARAFNAMAAELAGVDRARRDLLANVSHELRTPLGALQALLENLADGVEPADPQALRTALAQTERLTRLVTQLLDLSRLEAGAVPLAPRSFVVRELLEQAAREATLDRPPVELVVDVEPEDMRADADPERLHQVVANLLANAVRHSPPAGRVCVSARPGLTIAVDDEGPGIPDHAAERVFERFERGRDGETGLGLAIARWIVEAHGGTIRAERADAGGCRMIVELPS
jgi:signal transduction histidine kinase